MQKSEENEFVSFEKTHEFKMLVELLQRQYPSLPAEKISSAVDMCMMQIQSPDLRHDLILCMAQKLAEKESSIENAKIGDGL